ncbi:threonine aldolase family protein [Halpernia frigidisoli]|uniref:L-threonine aldolase n=1 Tax=Halpernia frigidisoli TaxID=1125876 RepID=A0A1I3DVW8_9FLAO|nr:aminotransferase class I/II-fold pyridoxal phosphate-dependent enzyme [Halpernia frigidisoli]SFH90793.1 L-threonine aldolase [Halpernia frigidisoli]
MKYSFKNDYSEGCHPKILEALSQTNLDQQIGYGLDEYCISATDKILKLCNSSISTVHFVSGGTQANLILISAFLRPHESVISATTGHIFTNETGAIEATGHKIHSVETDDGKLKQSHIQSVLDLHQNKPHQLKQKLVYISNSTEIGTNYSKDELISLSNFCKEKKLYLMLDGARLGHALTAENNDLTLADIAKYTDAFYLGGTKNGALIGEAIIINNQDLQDEFGFHIKQKGGMLAKGRLLGIQFDVLMENNLYFDLAKHANFEAMKIKKVFSDNGFEFLSETFTNQIFPVLNQNQIDQLSESFDFYVWKKIDEEFSAIRLITSWATPENVTDQFCEAISGLKK